MKDLATALSKAQAQITIAIKDATNPHYNSQYATLASTWEALRAPLTKNGLSVLQYGKLDEKGQILVTRLTHESGEFVESEIRLINQKADMQGLGSAWSYARRYGLQAITGIAQDDDDGNLASIPVGGQNFEKRAHNVTPSSVASVAPPKPRFEQAQARVDQAVMQRKNDPVSCATIHFGKNKGKALWELNDKQLDWYFDNAMKQTKKSREDEELIANIQLERENRHPSAKGSEEPPAAFQDMHDFGPPPNINMDEQIPF